MSADIISYDLKRFAGIKRDYGPDEIDRLRGSIKVEYSICKQQSNKLWNLLNSEPYINTLGSLSGNHAVQHAKGYEWLQMRSILVPMVGVTSNLGIWILIAGAVITQSSPTIGGSLVSIGILGFAFGTLFSLVTLPVEFDASKRAIYWLERKRIVNQRELVQSKEALNWAAGTYVVAALASIANLVYLWMRFGKIN